MLEELLQVYAIVVFGMDAIRNVAATKTAIALMNNNLFMFVIVLTTINIIGACLSF